MTATTKPAQASEKIHALTSLRFFAALFVVLFHTVLLFVPGLQHESLAGRFFGLGYVSVSFFFLLSGYILGMVYLRRGNGVKVRSFYQARFARVYPLFFLTLILDTPFLFLARLGKYGLKSAVLKTLLAFAGNVVLIQSWVQILRGIDNPNWSLSVEAFFYLLFPFIGVALWKMRGWQLWVTGGLLYVGGQVLVLGAVKVFGSYTSQFLPILHLSTFALGILLARWQTLERQKPGATGRTNSAAAYLVTFLALAGIAAAVYWAPAEPDTSLYDGLLAPVFAALIWAFSHSDWFPARLLSAGWLVVLGEASFGLYLFHLPIFHLFQAMGWMSPVWILPLYLAISIAVSVLSFYYFETPLRRWILKSGRNHVKETMETASSAQ